jgi:hypothetical protein
MFLNACPHIARKDVFTEKTIPLLPLPIGLDEEALPGAALPVRA